MKMKMKMKRILQRFMIKVLALINYFGKELPNARPFNELIDTLDRKKIRSSISAEAFVSFSNGSPRK